MNDKILYNRLPVKYQLGGDMPTQIDIQESIDNFMLSATHAEIEEWERIIKFAV